MRTFLINEDAVLKVAKLLSDLDDAYPDVGMGPGFDSFLDDACVLLGVSMPNELKAIILKKWRGMYVT